MTVEKIHIDMVRVGDVVRCADGLDRTVCAKDLRTDPFMGRTLWGDSYRLGYKPVTVVRMDRLPTREAKAFSGGGRGDVES